jgi:hypothetical protein
MVFGNWQLSPIVRLRSGQSLSVTTGVDTALNGTAGQRASFTGLDPFARNRSKVLWFDRAAFIAPAVGTYGNQGANALRGPGTLQFDIGISRTFGISEGKTIQFRAESFNVPNHTNPGNPVLAINSSVFGQIQTAGDPRIVQFALKLVY